MLPVPSVCIGDLGLHQHADDCIGACRTTAAVAGTGIPGVKLVLWQLRQSWLVLGGVEGCCYSIQQLRQSC
jgi:hypothetical protein